MKQYLSAIIDIQYLKVRLLRAFYALFEVITYCRLDAKCMIINRYPASLAWLWRTCSGL